MQTQQRWEMTPPVVVGEYTAILQLIASKVQALLLRRDPWVPSYLPYALPFHDVLCGLLIPT